MKMRMNHAIMVMASKMDCDYAFALGIFLMLKDMDKAGELDTMSGDRFYYELGFMSRQSSQKISRIKREDLCEVYREVLREVKREDDRERQREYYKRKRTTSLSPTPPISPVEKEKYISPPVLLRNTAPQGTEPAKKYFVKPTREQLEAYAQEIDYNLRVDSFLDYYEGNGWMVGRNHMKDWKATVRQWKRRDEERGIDTHARRAGPSEQDLFAGMSAEDIAILEQLASDGEHFG